MKGSDRNFKAHRQKAWIVERHNEILRQGIHRTEDQLLKEGNDVAIIAIGVMVHKALEAAENLRSDGINATVVDMHTIKPLDTVLLDQLANSVSGIVTVEDHSIIGGLGSAVSEYLSENNPTKIRKIGVEDRFGESGGTEELLSLVGLTVESIETAARAML